MLSADDGDDEMRAVSDPIREGAQGTYLPLTTMHGCPVAQHMPTVHRLSEGAVHGNIKACRGGRRGHLWELQDATIGPVRQRHRLCQH